ncbi:MAG: acylphosphatase [Verrucomicrobia bacterium]|nr:acylphosphatase [Verrucomicrobiota bacterium]
MTTYEITYEGKVQGVGFRATVLGLARGFDVAGEVKNLPDGRVHLILQGEEEEIEEFLKAIRESSLSGHIFSEQKTEMTRETSPRLRGFKIVK